MYSFNTGKELLEQTKKHKMPISEVVLNYESEFSNISTAEVKEKMKERIDVTKKAIKSGLENPQESVSGMSGQSTSKLKKVVEKKLDKMTTGEIPIKAMMYALAITEHNASMGRIVAFPTAGASGVVPATVLATAETFGHSKDDILKAMFTASGIGLIIAQNATLSGAKGGCQAEVGSATAMAAAAVTEMRGGTPKQCLHAAALALKNKLGLTCDPIGGMVEVPCIKRNALATVHSLGASDLAMAGVESFVPFDQVVKTMSRIGSLISPKLRETSLGGLAITPTGKGVERKLGIKISGKNGNGCGDCEGCG